MQRLRILAPVHDQQIRRARLDAAAHADRATNLRRAVADLAAITADPIPALTATEYPAAGLARDAMSGADRHFAWGPLQIDVAAADTADRLRNPANPPRKAAPSKTVTLHISHHYRPVDTIEMLRADIRAGRGAAIADALNTWAAAIPDLAGRWARQADQAADAAAAAYAAADKVEAFPHAAKLSAAEQHLTVVKAAIATAASTRDTADAAA